MSGWLWYVAGFFTLPVLAYIGTGILWATNKNHGTECGNCGKVLGRIRVDHRLGTELRWKAHYLRYWYLTRPNWTCQPTPDPADAKRADERGDDARL